MEIENAPGWVFYLKDNGFIPLSSYKCGKWMYFFTDREFAKQICVKAIESGIVDECKHSDHDDGVSCFYINCDDLEAHRRVIDFFIENDLIRKTKAGKFYNISFKLDDQTRDGLYREDFNSLIRLDKFIDLNTGAWHMTEEVFESIMPPEVQSELRYRRKLKIADRLIDTEPEKITYQQCLDAVETSCKYLEFVPERFKTEEICLLAAQKGRALSCGIVQFIPSHILTREFVDTSVRKNPYLFDSFPEHLLNQETAISMSIDDTTVMTIVPKSLKDEHFYTELLKHHGMLLRRVPKKMLNQTLCGIAVNTSPAAVKYIPDSLIDAQTYLQAVELDWKVLRVIPEKYRSKDLIDCALAHHPKAKAKILSEAEKWNIR